MSTHKGKLQGILAGALALQVVLAVVTWNARGGSELPEARPLLEVDEAAVTALEITEKPVGATETPETIRLEKQGDGWVVASAGGFPAKKDKVEELVGKLANLKVRDPIGTQKANHNALRVGADVWSRKVKVTAGGQTKDLVIGSGPGASIHARFADADAVFRGRGLSESAISGRVSSYVETELVKVDVAKLKEIQVTNASGTLSFRKEGEDWQLAELPAGQTLDQAQAKSFASSVARLTMKAPVSKTVDAAHGLENGATKVTLTYADDANASKTLSYAIGAAKDDAHYVKADGQEFVVLVSDWSTKSAREKTANDFVKKEEAAAAPPPGGIPGHGGMPPFPMPAMPPGE
jgi:hypothetical protein